MIDLSPRYGRSASLVPPGIVLACLLALGAAVAMGKTASAAAIATVAVAVAVFSAWPRFFTRWDVLLFGILAVILFVPIKRYKLPVSLPFDLEPYRIVVAVVAGLWISSLLIDRRISLRRTVLDPPLVLIGAVVLGSILTNLGRIAGDAQDTRFLINASLADEVVKALLFLTSIILVYYLVASIADGIDTVHFVLKTLVAGAAIVAVFAIVEARTQYNVFDHLSAVVPILQFDPSIAGDFDRGGSDRVYGSAQHPIALGAVFVMLLPVALYLVHVTRHRRWWIAAALLAIGLLSTLSRTGLTMLAAAAVVFLVLRSAEIKRLLPLLVPALVIIHAVLPGAIGSYRQAFFPPGGIVREQTDFRGRVSAERTDPQFSAIASQPFFGVGYGTQVTTGPTPNAYILDNQWLGTTVETGLIGLAAWLWFFARFIRRAGKEAKRDPTARGLLLTALVSALAAFGVGMLTYDAFSFIQATFVMFILAAIGSRVLDGEAWEYDESPGASAARLTRPAV